VIVTVALLAPNDTPPAADDRPTVKLFVPLNDDDPRIDTLKLFDEPSPAAQLTVPLAAV
jgi:hypothetical protein